MEEINNFQQEPDESLFRAWERFKELLMKCPQHYLTDMQEVILFYNGLDVPTRQILYSRGVILSKTAADAKVAIQEMAEYSQKWHNGTSSRSRSTETSNGLAVIQDQLKNLGREIKKVNEKVYAAQVGCEQCKGPHYTKDCPQKEEGKILEEAYYTQFGAPYQPGGQCRATRPGFYQRNNGNSSYPARRDTMEESLSKFMAESAKKHEENSNIIKEIRASTNAAIRNQGASIKTLELQIGQMSKVLQERGFGSLPSSTETNPKDQVKSISTATTDSFVIHRMDHGPYAVSGSQHRLLFNQTVPFPRRLHNYCCDDLMEAHGVNILDAYNNNLPLKEKYPGSFTLPCERHEDVKFAIHGLCIDDSLVINARRRADSFVVFRLWLDIRLLSYSTVHNPWSSLIPLSREVLILIRNGLDVKSSGTYFGSRQSPNDCYLPRFISNVIRLVNPYSLTERNQKYEWGVEREEFPDFEE
ncbi:hypothetical protein Tco_1111059 [Tanacetum coccineum]|uniref:Retrotransposon gag domain-containing protein n=1 Tax=Tanacetum coccineum TaxID=301880 RepID=A0ABQ5IL10_9ASTR